VELYSELGTRCTLSAGAILWLGSRLVVVWVESSVLRGWDGVEMVGTAGLTRMGDSGSWDARSQRRRSRRYYAVNQKANGASNAGSSVCLPKFARSQMHTLSSRLSHEGSMLLVECPAVEQSCRKRYGASVRLVRARSVRYACEESWRCLWTLLTRVCRISC